MYDVVMLINHQLR